MRKNTDNNAIAGQAFAGVMPIAVIIGSSSGIGKAVANQLTKMPHWQTIYVGSRNAIKNTTMFNDHRIKPFNIDISDEQSITMAFNSIRAENQHIGLLCCTAGLLHGRAIQPEKRLADLDIGALQTSFATNAFGPAMVMQQAQSLLQKKPAVLINVSARVGSIDDNRLGGWYAYRASKAAQNMFTRTACIEIGRRNKRFAGIAFHPGTTSTPLSEPFRGGVPEDKLFSAERAARQLLEVASSLTPAENGSFKAWDGSDINW